MWIGSIRLVVATKDATDAGTDHLVTASVLRDGFEVAKAQARLPHGGHGRFREARMRTQIMRRRESGAGRTGGGTPASGVS